MQEAEVATTSCTNYIAIAVVAAAMVQTPVGVRLQEARASLLSSCHRPWPVFVRCLLPLMRIVLLSQMCCVTASDACDL